MNDPLLPPLPHSEGGPPASQKDPGNPRRELIHEVRNLSTALPLLSAVVDRIARSTPSRREVAIRRRRSIAGLLLAVLAAMITIDEHTEYCGPGARAEAGVSVILSGGAYPAVVEALAGADSPTWCDISFPFHTHNNDAGWPTGNNIAGLVLYILIIIGVSFYALRPIQPADRSDHVTR